jgi:hypothetical protein
MVFGKVGIYESAVPGINQALFLERHADAPYNAALQLAAKRLDVELLAQRKRSHPSDNANRSQISIDPQLAELGAEAVHGPSAIRALFSAPSDPPSAGVSRSIPGLAPASCSTTLFP